MTQTFFITASGTGVGKTLVTTALCRQWRAAGKQVAALKPIITGYDAQDEHSDTALLLASCGLDASAVDAISPWRFAAPMAPDRAAAREGRTVDWQALLAFCRTQEACDADIALVEGIGGVMVPLDAHHTVLDWMQVLGWPVIMVTGSYLGSLSHTLTALAALAAKNIKVVALIVSESEGSTVSMEDTLASLKNFVPDSIPLVPITRLYGKNTMRQHIPSPLGGGLGWGRYLRRLFFPAAPLEGEGSAAWEHMPSLIDFLK